MIITEYSDDRAKQVTDLFYEAVHKIDLHIYSTLQKNAWASFPIKYDQWQSRLSKTRPTLLMINNNVVGFAELNEHGHIDCFYVSPSYQRQGTGSKLLKYLITFAKRNQLTYLTVDASIVAKPFFENFQFVVEKENKVIRQGLELVNYSMYLIL